MEELQRFGPDVAGRLERIARDASIPQLARVRAVSSLGRLDTEDAFQRIERLVGDDVLPVRARMAAAWTLGRFFRWEPARVALLRRILRDRDPGVREQAVRALARVDTPEARAALEAHRLAERHVAVRAVLREVKAAQGAPVAPREGRRRRPKILWPKEGVR